MNYQQLIRGILSLDTNDTAALNKISTLLGGMTNSSAVQLIQKLSDLENVANNINALNSTQPPSGLSPRSRYINRIQRLSHREAVTIQPKSVVPAGGANPIEPYFKKMDISWFEFGGTGAEFDGHHLALIWHDDHNREEITVIPLTSQPKAETEYIFDLGRIHPLRKPNNVFLVHKMANISRKRAVPGNNGAFTQAFLPLSRAERFLWAIAYTYVGEKSLHSFVRNKTGDARPVHITSYRDIRYMPVRDISYDRPTCMVSFRKWNEDTPRTLQLKRPTTAMPRGLRKEMIYDQLFNSATQHVLGMTNYMSYY
jgi:hypothetical protein